MVNHIKRLRRIFPKGRSSRAIDGPADLPLDRQLTFEPGPGEKWTFDEDRGICVNDIGVKEMLASSGNDVGLLCGLSYGIYEHQRYVWSRGGKGHAVFNAAANSLQGTILERLGTIYDGLTGGVHFECDGSDFWINNVNVDSVLRLYRLRPTEKARTYLFGLRDKLGLILSRQRSSTRYDGIRIQASRLIDEITLALECIPSDAHCRLLDGRRSA